MSERTFDDYLDEEPLHPFPEPTEEEIYFAQDKFKFLPYAKSVKTVLKTNWNAGNKH